MLDVPLLLLCRVGLVFLMMLSPEGALAQLPAAAVDGMNMFPKMMATPVVSDTNMPLRPTQTEIGSLLSSNNAVFVGLCTPTLPFTFVLSGGSGLGSVGMSSNAAGANGDGMIISFQDVFASLNPDAVITINDDPIQGGGLLTDFFPGIEGDDGIDGITPATDVVGKMFRFENVPSTGTIVEVSCLEETNVMVDYEDDSTIDTLYVQATITSGNNGQGNNNVEETYTLLSKGVGTTPNSKSIEVEAFKNNLASSSSNSNNANNNANANANANANNAMMMMTRMERSNRVTINNGSGSSTVTIVHDLPGEIVMLQATIEGDDHGNTVHRSFISKTRELPPTTSSDNDVVTMSQGIIDTNGDICITFEGVGGDLPTPFVDVVVRIGVSITGQPGFIEEVDTRAVVTVADPTIKIHGGWVRSKLQRLGLSNTNAGESWDVVLVDAYVSDPENSQRNIGRLSSAQRGMNMGMNNGNNGNMLSAIPTVSEMEISNEMRFGRRPSIQDIIAPTAVGQQRERERERELLLLRGDHNNINRDLQVQQTPVTLDGDGHTKILIHGYCSRGNGWPVDQFTPSARFTDPLSGSPLEVEPMNWSHLDFAWRILRFGWDFQIQGCGIMAHSQGGAASLTLYNTWWSCLDFADRGGSQLINTVGTPWGGTPIAGDVAAIGEVFGIGCGANNDLTVTGSANWQTTIANVWRSQVHYYRTQYTDHFWWPDFCEAFTSPFLSGFDDGVIEVSRSVLSGGNNRGISSGECHRFGQRDPAQQANTGRNSFLNANVRY